MRIARVSLFVTFHAFATVLCSAQLVGIDRAGAAMVEQRITQAMQNDGIVGCSVGIVKRGRIVYLQGFGYRDLENRFPATEYTLYRTGSIAKTFTAVLALQLAEQGKLLLENDVRTLVPEYPAKPQGLIKIGHLMTHRSGIRHYAEYDTALLQNYETTHESFDAIDAIDVFKKGSLSFTPGFAYQYSTFGYNLLGAAIERAAGLRFQDLLENGLRRRLNLPYLQPEIGRLRPYPEESKGYDRASGTLRQTIDNTGILYKVPGGGMICTVVDLCLFIQGLSAGLVFDSASTLEVMGTVISPEASYGLGVFVGSWNGRRTLYHSGGQEKTSTYFICVPGTADGVAVMTNTYAAPARALGEALLDLVPMLVESGPDYKGIPDSLDAPSRVFPDMDEVVYNPVAALRWTPVQHADRYIVHSDITQVFAAPRRDTVRGTTHTLQGLAPGRTLYWRVQALNPFLRDTARSAWSGAWRFRTPTATGSDAGTKISDRTIFNVCPNPVRETFCVRSTKDAPIPRALELWSMDGRLVREWRGGIHEATFDVRDVSAGAYILRLRDQTPWSSSRMILINR